jgi:hypothetical protein
MVKISARMLLMHEQPDPDQMQAPAFDSRGLPALITAVRNLSITRAFF